MSYKFSPREYSKFLNLPVNIRFPCFIRFEWQTMHLKNYANSFHLIDFYLSCD